MSNNDKKQSKSEYFDMRERRLKLVYKILYVVVAIWIAIILTMSKEKLEISVVPMYAFMLSASSMVIIQIVKYAIMELRCMKIVGRISKEVTQQTEIRYDNIWKSFSLILLLCGIALILHNLFVEQVTANIFMTIFSICIGYFVAISIIRQFEKDNKDKTLKILDAVGIVVGTIAAYSLCAATCLITNAM